MNWKMGRVVLLAVVLSACGGSLITLAQMPVYADAKEIPASSSQLLDGITKLSKASPTLQRILQAKEQKIYTLPKDAAWTTVNKYYEIQLDKLEFQIIPASAALLENVKLPTDISAYQTATWVRGSQTFSIIQVNAPGAVELIVSLATP